jgi:hypothetical protein
VLLIGGESGPSGVFSPGSWPPEPPTPSFPAPGDAVEPTSRWIANEAAIVADIRRQCGGLPPSLVGLEVANEPPVTPTTLPMLARALAAARREVPGVPVTIGGWRTPARHHPGERWAYNDPAVTAEIARLVDFVSVHLYPDNIAALPGGTTRTATSAAAYLPVAESFLQTVIADARRKPVMVGEFGGVDGRPETVPFQPAGGSMAHQAAVVEAVTEAMVHEARRGVTGGTVWLFEQSAGAHFVCTPDVLVCFGRPPTPAVRTLAAAAAHDDRRP